MSEATATIQTRTLVLGMVGDDGDLDAGLLYDVGEACGMSDQQVRLCLRRLVADGTLRHLGGRGRRGRFRAEGDPSASILPELAFVEFAFEQDAGRERWDGQWRLVAFTLDRERRSERDELRARLLNLGGAPLHAGLYASPNDWDMYVDAEADRLGVRADLLRLRTDRLDIGGVTEPHRLARRLWPLEEVAAGYRNFARVTERRLRDADGIDPREALVRAFATTLAFSEAITPDPLLPPELLPAAWPGAAARQLLLEATERFDRLSGDGLPHALHRLRRAAEPLAA